MQNNNIHFHYLVDPFFFPNRNQLKTFLMRYLKKEKKDVSAINYIFCTDEYLLDVNKTYLEHNFYTDIITFELSGTNESLVADIFISIERVKENAASFGYTFSHELHRVIFHGILHLCGYKDKTEKDSLLMRRKEEELIKKFLVSRETL